MGSTVGRQAQVVDTLPAKDNVEVVQECGWNAGRAKRACGGVGGKGAWNLDDRVDSHLDKVCGYRTEGIGNLCASNSAEEAVVPNAEDQLMLAMAAEKVLHPVCTDGLPYLREHPMDQTKMMQFAACQVEAEGLLASRRNAQAAITVFDEGE